MKYFNDNQSSSIELVGNIIPVSKKIAKNIFNVSVTKHNNMYGNATVSFVQTKTACYPITRKIDYKKNPSKHICSAKCRTAKGHICECECGGLHHGIDS